MPVLQFIKGRVLIYMILLIKPSKQGKIYQHVNIAALAGDVRMSGPRFKISNCSLRVPVY